MLNKNESLIRDAQKVKKISKFINSFKMENEDPEILLLTIQK